MLCRNETRLLPVWQQKRLVLQETLLVPWESPLCCKGPVWPFGSLSWTEGVPAWHRVEVPPGIGVFRIGIERLLIAVDSGVVTALYVATTMDQLIPCKGICGLQAQGLHACACPCLSMNRCTKRTPASPSRHCDESISLLLVPRTFICSSVSA